MQVVGLIKFNWFFAGPTAVWIDCPLRGSGKSKCYTMGFPPRERGSLSFWPAFHPAGHSSVNALWHNAAST